MRTRAASLLGLLLAAASLLPGRQDAPTLTPAPNAPATTATSAPEAIPVTLVTPEDPVLVGAGDIAACDSDGDEKTAVLLDNIPGTVFTLGDNAYPDGTREQFAKCYEPTWGRHKARTRPAAGNHDYQTRGASGYFDYFGSAAGDRDKGYYSYELGRWHVVVINSNCRQIGGCHEGSPQENWLRADLASHRGPCTVAMWHHPRFSSAEHGNDPSMRDIWKTLQDKGVDLVLAGHDHDYERFGPQDADGNADENGIRSIVAGTGGRSFYPFGRIQPNSIVRHTGTPGVLKLTLRPDSYDWEFVPAAGSTFTDTGTAKCR
jgi:acid phosphatase type 7